MMFILNIISTATKEPVHMSDFVNKRIYIWGEK